MANINIVCVGKLKEPYWKAAQAEYIKRLSAFCKPQVIEKKEVSLPSKPSLSLVQKACAEESESLATTCTGYIVALSPEGDKMSSKAFASFVSQHTDTLSFAIGGSYGLSPEFKTNANKVLSFSDMIMPHQLFRIVFLEQIYRAFMIANNRTYHK